MAAFTGLTVTVKDAYKRQTPVLVIFVKMNSLKYDSEMNYSRIIENNLERNVNGFFFNYIGSSFLLTNCSWNLSWKVWTLTTTKVI